MFYLGIQPNERGFYAITTLSQASTLYAHSIKKCCAITTLLYQQIIEALVSEYQRPCKTALDHATAALARIATIPEARAYFNNIDEANELERMAARFAWLNTHQNAPDLDPMVPLKTIISTSDVDAGLDEDNVAFDNGLATVIDFSHVNALPNYDILSRLLIDFALVSHSTRCHFHMHNCMLNFNDETNPIIVPINGLLRIDNALQCTSFIGLFTPLVREIYLNNAFPVLASTAGLITPALTTFWLNAHFEAPQLQSLLIQATNLQRLYIEPALPSLAETNINEINTPHVSAAQLNTLRQIIEANLAGNAADSDDEEGDSSDDEVIVPEAAVAAPEADPEPDYADPFGDL